MIISIYKEYLFIDNMKTDNTQKKETKTNETKFHPPKKLFFEIKM